MNNEVRGKTDPLADKVAEQTEIMQNQISHHLDRARMAARVGVVGSLTEISPIMQSLERALLRIYQDKNITFNLECPDQARFAGEKQDFEEIIGNLLDNAFKWANNEVSSKIKIESNKMGETLLNITIQDDGPGLSDKELSQVKERGKRLDETKPGSGLGLSIVSDLVDLYGGKIDLSHSKLGGLQIKLQLPAGS
jgi:signal transduction histidine kinase